jgi:hypothetical protein
LRNTGVDRLVFVLRFFYQTFVDWRRNSDSTDRDDGALEFTADDDAGSWQRAIERVQVMLNYVGLTTNEWSLQDVVIAQYQMLVARRE